MFQNDTILFIFIFIIGGVCNRIRGGWLTDVIEKKLPSIIPILKKLSLWDKKKGGLNGVKDFNAIIFGILFGILTKLWLAPAYYLFMRFGLAQGWGGYIDAMISKRIDHSRDDVTILDKWFRGDDEPVLSGWAALSLRGLMATIIISLPFLVYYHFTKNNLILFIPLLGLAMGSIYLAACEVCERITFRGNGWQWGEVIFGGYLWATIYLMAV